MAITKYILSEARKLNPIGNVESYNKQRQEIYEKLKDNRYPEKWFNNDNFNKIQKQYNFLQELPKELKNFRISSSTQGHLFNGTNDTKKIQELINQAKSLQHVEDFNQYTEIFNQMEQSANFIKKIKGKINSQNVFAISTNDYNLMKNAILKAQKDNDIQQAKKIAKQYYSGLLGNLGETIGIIQGYQILSKELQQQLKKIGIDIQVSNTGSKVEGKRAIGDTTISFVAQNNEIIGSISMSNKLSANYGQTTSSRIKLRTTFPTQIKDITSKSLYYNLFSLHGSGRNKTYELYPNKSKEIIAFRRYLAATIMQETLFGAFSGDNVYYFNYGEYIYTMNDLLKFWTYSNTPISGVPLASLPGHKKRLDIMKNVKTEEEADTIIGKQEIIIAYNFHLGNINNALGI